jgi:integrase
MTHQLCSFDPPSKLFFMGVTIIKKQSRGTGEAKVFYTLAWGREAGQRAATGIFTYVHPKGQFQKNHNKESLAILENKKSQMILDQQSIAAGYIPKHNYKSNFLDYYAAFVKNNKQPNNRHIEGSLAHFKAFLGQGFLAPIEVTENLCQRFRKYLLDRFNGDTPANYFSRFKRVVKAATKEGYFRINPADEVAAKSNKNHKRKEHLEVDEYIAVLRTPCLNEDLREAFILCCYTGLRWCDVKPLNWKHIKEDEIVFTITQEKTLVEQRITLHPIAKAILDRRLKRAKVGGKNGLVFKLPSQDMALRTLDNWCKGAGIQKHITWHSARLSFSILLQDANVDDATVALLLGHQSTQYVHKTYKRFRPKDQTAAISKLPSPV